MSDAAARRTGRRPGTSGAREDILAAATRAFAELGYERATIRHVAKEASVDPALVHHYFGSKRALFVAAMNLPVNPAELVEGLIATGETDTLAERVLRTMMGVWDHEQSRAPLVALIRSAMSDDDAATMVREFITVELVGRLVRAAGDDRPDLRVALLSTQIMGLLTMRYVLRLEPLASADVDTVVGAVAPNLQRYLTGPLQGP
ncbi:MAG: TetR family transcriptional regulator [Actinomycetota bacterium]